MHVVLLGSSGAGKGTQAVRLAREKELALLATGEMLREHVRSGTALGKRAEPYMDRGEFVPDEVAIRVLLERLDWPDAAGGSVQDGFPRTVEQAKALDAALAKRSQQVTLALLIDVSPAESKARLTARWTCPSDGAIYHERTQPPQRPGRCDRCGSSLVRRDDDRPEAVARRLEVYEEEVRTLLEYYERAAKLVRINGEQPAEAVWRDLLAAVDREGG